MDFYYWSYIKSKVYNTNSKFIDTLQENILREMACISKMTCRTVVNHFRVCLQKYRGRTGFNLDVFIFIKWFQ